MPDTSEPIETTFTSDIPAGAPPPADTMVSPPLSRAEVLGRARVLAAAITGLAALVEQASERVRPHFLDAWRQWCGAWMGYYQALERMPFRLDETAATLQRRGQTLEIWRRGLKMEMGAPAAMVSGAQGPEIMQPRTWPWWAQASVAVGLGYGAYRIVQWVVRSWSEGSE